MINKQVCLGRVALRHTSFRLSGLPVATTGKREKGRKRERERVAGLYVKSYWWAHGPWELPL